MAKPNPAVIVALLLVATTSVANCQFFGANITQFQVFGSGLTCSNPSPFLFSFFFSRPFLSGANVTLTCNGGSALNTTTTTDSGGFSLTVNNPVITNSFFPLFNCRLLLTVPNNCTITSFFFQPPVTTLRSIGLFPTALVSNPVGGQILTVRSGIFLSI